MKRPANPIRRITSTIQKIHSNHKARHTPTGFGFLFSDCIDFIDPLRWDSVTRGSSVFLRRDVLRVLEEHGPENLCQRYAMIFRGDNPVGALAVQVVTVNGSRLGSAAKAEKEKKISRLMRLALKPAAEVASAARNKLRDRMLVAGNLLAWGCHGVAFAPGEDAMDLWPAIAEAIYRIRRAERLTGQADFAMVKDITAAQTGLEALRRFSYRPMETEPNMVLELSEAWRSYEDYLGALDAKYRRNAKDLTKKIVGAGCTIEAISDLKPHARRLHELYLAVHEKASVRLVTLREGYLPALAQSAGADFKCTAIRRDGEILGFVTSFKDGDTAIGYYIGFDRAAAAAGLPIYLRLLHATVEHAISWGCKRLSLGRTALEPKAALGARPEPMSVWLRHRVPPVTWLLRGLLNVLSHDEAPERSPFKAAAKTVSPSAEPMPESA